MSKKLRSDRREARRQGARERFKLLSMDEYITTSLGRTKNRMTIGNGDAGYDQYLERKLVEGIALGIVHKTADVPRMIRVLADPTLI